jgi:hypothetical protein
MKYMLLFCGSTDDDEAWANMPEDTKAAAYAQIGAWFERNQAKIEGGYELQHQNSATTVRWNGQKPIVTDGPFTETGEIVAGYCVVNVADLDEALSMAKSWPGHGPAGGVEIRPVVDR